jgi:hypothetical protein
MELINWNSVLWAAVVGVVIVGGTWLVLMVLGVIWPRSGSRWSRGTIKSQPHQETLHAQRPTSADKGQTEVQQQSERGPT